MLLALPACDAVESGAAGPTALAAASPTPAAEPTAEPVAGRLGIAVPFYDLVGGSTAEMEAELTDYAEMGVDLIRTDFWWHIAQPTKAGGYQWAQIDRAVDAAARHGIGVIGILSGMPSWTGYDLSQEANQRAYGEFAAAAAAHFGDRVDYWEVFNEPNMADIPPAAYTGMLTRAYDAIKAVDPGDVVISGGLAPAPSTAGGIWGAVDYLEAIYASGGGGHFDAVGYHPYTYPLLPEDSESWNGWQIMEDGIRRTMAANGDAGLRVWMTELGAPTTGADGAVTQAEQAQIVEQAVDLATDYSWAGPVLWYSYEDRGGATDDKENWFGLVGPGGTRKEAYQTFKALATAQRDAGALAPTFTGQRYKGTNGPDRIVGNGLDNRIYGVNGDDTIYGMGGDDRITGGRGNDALWGGEGADEFLFGDPEAMGWDTIRDFERGDVIDLSKIDADATVPGNQAFTFIGGAWLSDPGDLGFYKDSNGWTMLLGDTDGDGAHDFGIRLDGLHDLTTADVRL